MITSSSKLKDLFYNNVSIRIDSGCYIEYDMNRMLDNISVVNNIADSSYTSQIVDAIGQSAWPSSRPNPYKKLFPVDSIVKPFRPINSGIKYFILEKSPGVDTTKNSFSSYRSVLYPETQPRVYYPGNSTYYKYWISPINSSVDIKVNYDNNGTQYALTNKIVIKFEASHTVPSLYTVKITKSDGTEITVANQTSPSDGNIVLNYNGTTWSPDYLPEPYVYAQPIAIKSISLTTSTPGSGKRIGVIEISARWIKDISNDVVSFDISKESSSSSEDLLPVGKITANNISLNLNKFDSTSLQYVDYNRTVGLNSSLNYMVKNAKIIPYFKIYHSDGEITEGSDKYDKIYQGYFYIDEYNISSYGEVSLNALDSSKYLMEVVCPDILCEFYPATAIIRRLLDSVGYTNYKFNLTSETDASIPLINYFWTDGSRTVWEYLQEICRDIQMNAIVDENDILQFYSRDYMYGRTTKNWNFYADTEIREAPESNILSNIIDFSQKQIASANQVKVIWSTPVSTSYLGTSGPLWQSPTKFLVAGGLLEPLNAAGNNNIAIKFETLDRYSKFQSGFNFNGYFLIDSEIIEYDAMGYQYVPKDTNPSTIYDVIKETNVTNDGNTFINIWIENSGDVNKYRNFSKPGSENISSDIYFKPNGRYRIKTRGALGTKAASHNSSGTSGSQYVWTGVLV